MDHETKNADDIIDAAVGGRYRRTFFLGPYARRVTFASQQNRALNLVWALHLRGRIGSAQKIAVVGAGLSGLTACTALADLGYDVYLYEKGLRPLNRQMSANHRYVHPTVNSWPHVSPCSTTAVPYFDWYSGICGPIMDRLLKEWNERQKENPVGYSEDCEVLEISENEHSVALVVKGNNKHPHLTFDAVLVTSGFSDEAFTDIDGIESYWDDDHLEKAVAAQKQSKFYVSGCGDGGLIDALRIAHKHETFRFGRLIVDVVEALEAEPNWVHRTKIAAEEDTFGDGAKLKAASENGSAELKNVYQNAANELPNSVLDLIGRPSDRPDKQSLWFNLRGLVTFVTREEFFYSPLCAPVHKLMVAHAVNHHVISPVHVRGHVMKCTRKELHYIDPHLDPEKMKKKKKEWRSVQGRIVVRHGARPNFAQFIKDDIHREALIEKQQLLAAQLDSPFWATASKPLVTWPPMPPFKHTDLKRRIDFARQILDRLPRQVRGANIHAHTEEGFYLSYAPGSLTQELLDSLPNSLFGIPFNKYDDDNVPGFSAPPTGIFGEPIKRTMPIFPGTEIRSGSINGRLGPLFRHLDGSLRALSAAHLFPKESPPEVHSGKTVIGWISDAQSEAPRSDVVMIKLNDAHGYTTRYGAFPTIGSFVDEDALFGSTALLVTHDGAMSSGFVSATHMRLKLEGLGLTEELTIPKVVRVTAPSGTFSRGGDSGAPVVDDTGRLMGIVVSFSGPHSFVVPVRTLADELGLTLFLNPKTVSKRGVHRAQSKDYFESVVKAKRAAIDERQQSIFRNDIPTDLDEDHERRDEAPQHCADL